MLLQFGGAARARRRTAKHFTLKTIMKKTMFMLAALCGVCVAATEELPVMAADFSDADFNGQTIQINGSGLNGWNVSGRKSTASVTFTENGAFFVDNGTQSYTWAQQRLYYQGLSLDSSEALSYTLTFTLHGNSAGNGCQRGFYLMSDAPTSTQAQYGIAFINDYNGWLCVDTIDNTDTSKDYSTAYFTHNDRSSEIGSTQQLTLPGNLDFTLTLSSGMLIAVVTDGEHTFSKEMVMADTFNFTTVGFVYDGDSHVDDMGVGVSGLTITKTVPEPATAALSLLALAGLAARRRR